MCYRHEINLWKLFILSATYPVHPSGDLTKDRQYEQRLTYSSIRTCISIKLLTQEGRSFRSLNYHQQLREQWELYKICNIYFGLRVWWTTAVESMGKWTRQIFCRHWSLCTVIIFRYTMFALHLSALYIVKTSPAWVTLWPLGISVTYVSYMIQRHRWQRRQPPVVMSPVLCRYWTNEKVSFGTDK